MNDSELKSVTDRLVESYSTCGSIHHLAHEPLPSREAVADCLLDLFELVYPGFGRRQNLNVANIAYHVGSLIDGVHVKLSEQIARALRHEGAITTDAEASEEARRLATSLLHRIPSVRRVLEQDVNAAFRGDPAAKSRHEIVFCYPGLEAITTYRIAHELNLLKVPYIPRMMTEIAHSRTGIDIHPGADIESGFFIDHGTGVVIGETTTIGKDVKLYQGVTLGALSFDRDESGELVHGSYKRHPTLRDNVVVYANATILGGMTIIGEGAVIGSNVWITKSVEPFSVVVLETPQLRVKATSRTTQAAVMYYI